MVGDWVANRNSSPMQMMNGGNSLFGTSVTAPTTTNPTV